MRHRGSEQERVCPNAGSAARTGAPTGAMDENDPGGQADEPLDTATKKLGFLDAYEALP